MCSGIEPPRPFRSSSIPDAARALPDLRRNACLWATHIAPLIWWDDSPSGMIARGEGVRHARRVWGAVGGDFCLATGAAADGLYLGSYHVHPGDALELVVWGLFAKLDRSNSSK